MEEKSRIIPEEKFKELYDAACSAAKNSYSPYSHFPVGAALLMEDGAIIKGANIENRSFGLTNCAERSAIFTAMSAGYRSFVALVIVTPASDYPVGPCGACRQVLNEFAPGIRVIVTWGDGQVDEMMLSQLLPHGFGPKEINA